MLSLLDMRLAGYGQLHDACATTFRDSGRGPCLQSFSWPLEMIRYFSFPASTTVVEITVTFPFPEQEMAVHQIGTAMAVAAVLLVTISCSSSFSVLFPFRVRFRSLVLFIFIIIFTFLFIFILIGQSETACTHELSTARADFADISR